MDINLFTVQARQEFLKGMQVLPFEKLPVAEFTTVVPSTARIENYLWMTPSPGVSEYVGHRRFAQLDEIKYTIENREFDGGISVSTRDIEDDQVGGYPMRFNELGQKAEQFPERWILQTLANGDSNIGFDNTNFFATAHNQGTGNSTLPSPFTGGLNLLTYTSANTSDGLTGKVVFMAINPRSGPVRPILYQRRKGPKFMTDAGTPPSEKAKQADYWVDLEAAALYGYWWDAIMVKTVNTPNILDVQTIIDQVIKQFLSFALPAQLASDPPIYVHQGLDMTTMLGVCVTGVPLSQLFYHVLNEDRIGISVAGSNAGITYNIYKGRFKQISSAYMV